MEATLDEIAAALPEAAAAAFDGDRAATVRDLYPVLVDQIARDRLQAGRIRLGAALRNGRPTALELFLDGLSASEPELPHHAGYAALNRRLSRWLDEGLGRRSSAPWKLGLHLDERGTALVLELWLHAEDDPIRTKRLKRSRKTFRCRHSIRAASACRTASGHGG